MRCLTLDPSVKSSLKFLRKTPWAREKVERLYLFILREIRRNNQAMAYAGGAAQRCTPGGKKFLPFLLEMKQRFHFFLPTALQ